MKYFHCFLVGHVLWPAGKVLGGEPETNVATQESSSSDRIRLYSALSERIGNLLRNHASVGESRTGESHPRSPGRNWRRRFVPFRCWTSTKRLRARR